MLWEKFNACFSSILLLGSLQEDIQVLHYHIHTRYEKGLGPSSLSQAARTIFRTDVISTCHFSLFPPHFPHISTHCRYCEVFVKEVEKHHAAMQAFILADKDTTEPHWLAYGTISICIYNSIDIASLFYHKNLSILFLCRILVYLPRCDGMVKTLQRNPSLSAVGSTWLISISHILSFPTRRPRM